MKGVPSSAGRDGAFRVSCVIPAYNAERWLAEAVASAREQTWPPAEIAVVDDGSTDATAEVAARLGRSVRVVRQVHQGQSAARNAGVAVSPGDVVAFLDADDVWEPDKLRQQLDLLRATGPDTVVFAHAQNVWADERQEEARRLDDQWVTRPFPAMLASTMLVPRPLFDRVGGFRADLRHGEIAEWVGRAQAAGARVIVHPEVLVRRRIHAGNNSRTVPARDDFFALLKARVDAQRRRPAPSELPGRKPAP